MTISLNTYGIPEHVAVAYADSLKKHIRFVKEAALTIGLDADEIANHDESKWSLAEFPGYALHFHGGGAPDRFAKAWLHHIHHNHHHWQFWMFPDGFAPKGSQVENGCIEMPEWAAMEMVADWMGASMAYTGSWDMADWLTANIPRIRLHSRTADYVSGILESLGYGEIVNTVTFGSQP